jgi:hypothetical protein
VTKKANSNTLGHLGANASASCGWTPLYTLS